MKKNTVSNVISSNGLSVTGENEIANILAQHFVSVYNEIDINHVQLGRCEKLETSPFEICKLIDKLPKKKSSGYSVIDCEVFKSCNLIFGSVLSKIFNEIFNQRNKYHQRGNYSVSDFA